MEGENALPPDLTSRLREEIRRCGPISFARFMELALYDPEQGYYCVEGPARLGPRGDYFTASDVGTLFGRAMARQLVEIDREIGPLDPFHVFEFGAGRGLLARDVLDAGGPLTDRLRYVLVDRSPTMLESARRLVPEARCLAPGELRSSGSGCAIAVELFDALPVHRLRRRQGALVEVRVGLDLRGDLVECEAPAEGHLAELAERQGAVPAEGLEAELCGEAEAVLRRMAESLDRGVVLVVDYGDSAARLYGAPRGRGTLLAYTGQRVHSRLLERPGHQDLTAHVNFTALADAAQGSGMRVLGSTTLDRFLIGNGILEAFEPGEGAGWRSPQRVRERLRAMQLIHPEAMGRRFHVLALAKGCEPVLSGLADPFARLAPR